MSVLTSIQINFIWTNRSSLLDYVYVCEDGNLYKGIKGGGLQRVLNSNHDTWLAQKKINANNATSTSNLSVAQTNNSNNQLSTIVKNVNNNTSDLTYDSNGNLIKKTLSLNGSVIENKTFKYDSDGGLTKLIKSDSNGVEVKDFNFNSNGDLISINIT